MGSKKTGFMAAWVAIISLVLFFALSNSVLAGPSTHVAVKGDSLKTICQAYYGNSDRWRELWQINPSIVNPDRIEPGFVVMLFTTDSKNDTPLKAAEKDIELLSLLNSPSSLKNTRIDVSDYTNVDALGFLSPRGVTPWGSIISDETERIFLAEGDMGCIAFEKEHPIKPGDVFIIYQSSQAIDHPITGDAAGYNISFLGRVVVKNKVRDNVYQAEIIESYTDIRVGDKLIPFTPVSSCVQLQELDRDLLKRNNSLIFSIVGAKDLQSILGKFSVVYLDRGYKQGVRRGNFFQVVDKGDAERQQISDLPYLIRGYVLILESRSDTSTGVVVYATKDFQPGALLRAVDLKSAFFEILSTYMKEFQKIVLEKGTGNLNLLEVLAILDRDVQPKPDLPEGLSVLINIPRCSVE
ncbi:MAG TPA: LysM peptidoglycan-binding domain-containing protein [Deltaproteobacteria bacterium]|nr:LysM peptidoglycan-binding domain-containing protein [Deltaproteobacteria bacterium]HIJ42101.1 LysM peptidoglycan-binding domain-containing protein [Deltaproteobacteria bacterium]